MRNISLLIEKLNFTNIRNFTVEEESREKLWYTPALRKLSYAFRITMKERKMDITKKCSRKREKVSK